MQRQFLWSMAPLVVVTVVNIFSVPLFFRFLGDERYAVLGYVATFSGMFGLADLGLGVAVGRYIGVALGSDDHASVREYWATGNLIAIPLVACMALVFSLVGVTFGHKWFNVSPANEGLLRACFFAGGFGLFLEYYGQFWNFLLQAHLKFKFIGALKTGTSLLQIIPSVILAWLTKNPLLIVLWSVFIGLVQLGLLVWHARRRLNLGFDLREARWVRAREMAAFTGKTFATLIASSLLGTIDQVILGRLAPAADFANYKNCAVNVGGRLQGLGFAIMGPVAYNTSHAVGGGRGASPAAIYNETFNFVFGWYLLAAVWTAVWHPIALRLWLGEARALQVAPMFTPIIIAFCLTGIATISAAQLGPLNRMGMAFGFKLAAGLLLMAGVYVGWHLGGMVGVVYGFLCSRVVFLAQDLYVIRLVKAGGWLAVRTWLTVAGQCLVGAGFALVYLVLPQNSLWVLPFAVLHGVLVAVWLLRHRLGQLVPSLAGIFPMRDRPAVKSVSNREP
ncbi:MAG: oligosaccharide flippase family protein [Verrucomicrobia bacterium]|nr:oligosaccharide flippase family protein [Verrucomicrobiota bacterium]